MKKFFSLLVTVAILFMAVACGGNNTSSNEITVEDGKFSGELTLDLGGELSKDGAKTIKGKGLGDLSTYFRFNNKYGGFVITVDNSDNVREGATSITLIASGSTTKTIRNKSTLDITVLATDSKDILKTALKENKTNTFKFKVSMT